MTTTNDDDQQPQQTLPGLIGTSYSEEPTSEQRQMMREKALAKPGVRPVDPDLCVAWDGNPRAADGQADVDADLLASIESVGQQVPVIGRRRSDGNIEIIAGGRRLAAVKRLKAQGADAKLLVEVRMLDDRAAYRVVAAENANRSDFTAYDQARFFDEAIKRHFGNETTLADDLGINKSTVSRTLDILRLPGSLMSKITDPATISAAQASSFMARWRDHTYKLGLQAEIDALSAGRAADVFRALAGSRHRDIDITARDGAILGTMRSTRTGSFALRLKAAAGKVEIDVLIAAIRSTLEQHRAP